MSIVSYGTNNLRTKGEERDRAMRTRTVYLDDSSKALEYLRSCDERVAALIYRLGALAYDVYLDDYEFLVWQIVGQMISNQAAQKIGERLVQACDGRITREAIDGLDDSNLRDVGLSRPKITYIRMLNESIEAGLFDFAELRTLDDASAREKLLSLHGVGEWTAAMYLIFVLDRQDVLVPTDRVFVHTFKWLYETEDASRGAILERSKKWSPYRSIVARYFYLADDRGLTRDRLSLIFDSDK